MLLEKGYLSDIAEFRNIADFRNAPNGLVAQPAERGFVVEKRDENKSPRWDLNPRPKVSAPLSRIMERGITKPSLCRLKLLGLLVFSLPSHVIIGFAQFRNPAVSRYPSVGAGLPACFFRSSFGIPKDVNSSLSSLRLLVQPIANIALLGLCKLSGAIMVRI